MPLPSATTPRSPAPSRLVEVILYFTRLGFTAFGGPAAHLALMEDEVVTRRRWLDRKAFLDAAAAIHFIPGPNSTELAIYLGYLRAGIPGLFAAGICFIVPAVLIILPLAYLYVKYGNTPYLGHALYGINAAIVAVVAAALWRFARTGIKDRFTAMIGALATLSGFLATSSVCQTLAKFAVSTHRWPLHLLATPAHAASSFGIALMHYQGELIILGIAAIAGAIWYGRPSISNLTALLLLLPLRNLGAGRSVRYTTMALASVTFSSALLAMTLLFLKVGATLFGSGYLLVTYLQSGLVDQHHWMTNKELLDAIAVGQITPGPLLTTATFVGYVLGDRQFHGGVAGGIIGAILATTAIFLPAFFIILACARTLPSLRRNRLAAGALDAMNATIVALILVAAVRLGCAAIGDIPTAAIAGLSLLVLLVWNINPTWLILVAALVGCMWHGTM